MAFYKNLTKTVSAIIAFCTFATPAQAQIAGLTQNDLGSTGAAGTHSYSSGTYTIAGAGSGIGGTTDSFSYYNTATSDNIEIVTRVASQTAVNNSSSAGLMMKDSITATSAQVSIAATPANGIVFQSRATSSAKVITTLDTAVSSTVYLRLVRSGSSFAGYQSSDGLNWQQVGYANIPTFSSSYYVGFAVSSNLYGTLSTATFDNTTYFTNVPQRNDTSLSIACWLRSDLGLAQSSGAATSWFDQSIYSLSALQTNSSYRPGYVSTAIQTLPAASFNGTSQYFDLSPWRSGMRFGDCSFFIVTKPTGAPNTLNYWFDLGTSPPNNNVSLAAPNTTDATYTTYNGTTAASLTATSAITQNAYQLVEVVQGSSTTKIYVNSTVAQSGSLAQSGGDLVQQSCIGQQSGGGNWFKGEIAEVIFCNRALSDTQRDSVETYIRSKYGPGVGHASRLYRSGDTLIGTALKQQQHLKPVPAMHYWNTIAMEAETDRVLIAQAVAAPTITPATGNYTTAQTVTMSAPAGSIYYTLDGTTPTNSSTAYSTPFDITAGTQVKAVAYSSGNYSPVTTNWIEVDPSTVPVATSGLKLWLRSDFGVTTTDRGKVTNWTDLSGNSNDASQSADTNQPTLMANVINKHPSVRFNPGTSGQFLQLPSGFTFSSNFQCGLIFIVGRATAVSAGARIMDFGNGTANNNFTVQLPSSTGLSLYVFNGSSSSNLTASSCLTLGQDALMKAAAARFFTADNISVNGTVQATGNLNYLNNVTRANNFIGQGSGGGNYFEGDIAEILVYNNYEDTTAKIESYLINKYQPLNAATPAPIFSVAAGTLAAPAQVALSAEGNATIRYTLDGTTPTVSSQIYTQPINIAYSQTIKAIAIGRSQSSVASAAYTLDSTAWPAPATGDTRPLQTQLQLPTNAQ